MQATVEQHANGRRGPAHRIRSPLSVADDKARLRAECEALRAGIGAQARAQASAQIADSFLAAVAPGLAPTAVIAGYWPFPDEVDSRPLMSALHARGHPLCLPVVERRGSPLAFRAWAPGEDLEPGVFGTSEPARGRAPATPDCLLVPLLAFDRDGFRLGFGAGYYDLTLAALEGRGSLAAGLAFAMQEVARLPREAHDRALDWVVTEREAVRVGARR
jgi:5-formyltetrahydrofolate cyclo-ligase